MAITTYSELKTAIEQWLDTAGDTTISSNVDEFIDLTEALIRRKPERPPALGGVRGDRRTETGTISASTLLINDAALELEKFELSTSSSNFTLQFVPVNRLVALKRSGTGKPKYWTIGC